MVIWTIRFVEVLMRLPEHRTTFIDWLRPNWRPVWAHDLEVSSAKIKFRATCTNTFKPAYLCQFLDILLPNPHYDSRWRSASFIDSWRRIASHLRPQWAWMVRRVVIPRYVGRYGWILPPRQLTSDLYYVILRPRSSESNAYRVSLFAIFSIHPNLDILSRVRTVHHWRNALPTVGISYLLPRSRTACHLQTPPRAQR